MKDQKGEVPRAGDKAMIIKVSQSGYQSLVGETINVISDPIPINRGDQLGLGILMGRRRRCVISGNPGTVSQYSRGEDNFWITTSHIIRIRPDEEARQLFAEKADSKPIKTKT